MKEKEQERELGVDLCNGVENIIHMQLLRQTKTNTKLAKNKKETRESARRSVIYEHESFGGIWNRLETGSKQQ